MEILNVFFKIAWRAVVYGILLVGGVSLYTFVISIRPPHHVTGVTPSTLGFEYEDVTIVTEDGVRLAAWFIPSGSAGKKAVIVCHGYPADKGDVLSFASLLHEDFNLLFFDFRAMGRSGGKVTTVGWRERKDFLAAVKYLKSIGMEKIGAFGFSMGGAVIIMAEDPDVDAIVSESAYADLESMAHLTYRGFGIFRHPFVRATRLWSRILIGLDLRTVAPREHIKNINVPILLVHSEKDSMIPAENARILKRSNPSAELWIIEGGEHGGVWGAARGEYEKRILDFLLSSM